MTALTIAQKFFERRVQLHVMCRCQDQAAIFAERGDSLGDLCADLVGTAEGKRVLLVHRPPKAQVLPVLELQAPASIAAGWTGFKTSRPISISSGMTA